LIWAAPARETNPATPMFGWRWRTKGELATDPLPKLQKVKKLKIESTTGFKDQQIGAYAPNHAPKPRRSNPQCNRQFCWLWYRFPNAPGKYCRSTGYGVVLAPISAAPADLDPTQPPTALLRGGVESADSLPTQRGGQPHKF
jgi:hypothetical protein